MKKKKISYFVAILLLVMIFLPTSEVSAKTTISSSSVTLRVGQSKTLKINGAKKNVTWSSSKERVAIVSDRGEITAKGKGTALITAKIGSQKYTCKVFVYKADTGNVKVDKKINDIIRKEIKASMSTLEKAKAIHDYLVLNCEYDEAARSAWPDTSGYEDSYSAKGALINKKAVCSGLSDGTLWEGKTAL